MEPFYFCPVIENDSGWARNEAVGTYYCLPVSAEPMFNRGLNVFLGMATPVSKTEEGIGGRQMFDSEEVQPLTLRHELHAMGKDFVFPAWSGEFWCLFSEPFNDEALGENVFYIVRTTGADRRTVRGLKMAWIKNQQYKIPCRRVESPGEQESWPVVQDGDPMPDA